MIRYVDLYVTDSFRFGFGAFVLEPLLCAGQALGWLAKCIVHKALCYVSKTLYRAAVVGPREILRFLFEAKMGPETNRINLVLPEKEVGGVAWVWGCGLGVGCGLGLGGFYLFFWQEGYEKRWIECGL